MRSLKMHGPFLLNVDRVDEIITEISPGCFALGYVVEPESPDFVVLYLGYDPENVGAAIKGYLDTDPQFLYFKYRYEPLGEEAFTMCCRHFHEFGGIKRLRNQTHPQRPDGVLWQCPLCEVYDQ